MYLIFCCDFTQRSVNLSKVTFVKIRALLYIILYISEISLKTPLYTEIDDVT